MNAALTTRGGYLVASIHSLDKRLNRRPPGGSGCRQWFFGDQMLVDGSAAISWGAHTMAQARREPSQLARSRLAIGTQVRWQDLTQLTFFGEGPGSVEADRGDYRFKSANAIATCLPFCAAETRPVVHPDAPPASLSVAPADLENRDVFNAPRGADRAPDRRWHDAFRAGGYPPVHPERFIRVLENKPAAGRRLGGLQEWSPYEAY
jgi:hypothetical protein